jgi:hypothetical protein
MKRAIGRLRTACGLTLLLVLAGLLAGCGTKGPTASDTATLTTFVGRVQESPAYIGLITDGDRLSGFVTDGNLNGKWFATADLSDGKAPLIARDGSKLGEATISGGRASGDVIVGLRSHPFSATAATGKGGLFTAAKRTGEDSFEAGWISLPDGSVLGTYDTFINGNFVTHPGVPLKPVVRIPGFGATAPHQTSSLFLDLNTQAH